MKKALPVKPPNRKLPSAHPFGVQTVHFNLWRESYWRTQAPIAGHAVPCTWVPSLGPTNHRPLYWGPGLRSSSGAFAEMSLKTCSPLRLRTQTFAILALLSLLPRSPRGHKMPETYCLGASSAVRQFPHLCWYIWTLPGAFHGKPNSLSGLLLLLLLQMNKSLTDTSFWLVVLINHPDT